MADQESSPSNVGTTTRSRVEEEQRLFRKEALEYQYKRQTSKEPIDSSMAPVLFILPWIGFLIVFVFLSRITYEPSSKGTMIPPGNNGEDYSIVLKSGAGLSFSSNDKVRLENTSSGQSVMAFVTSIDRKNSIIQVHVTEQMRPMMNPSQFEVRIYLDKRNTVF